MLTDELTQRIQEAYRSWLDGKGFRPRYGQRLMIAEIARALTGDGGDAEPLAVVEAGTGTGKTIAYSLAAIPVAQALDKTLVVATATVALQEQIVLRDLPDVARHSGLVFSSALAKGRSRYLCLAKLDTALSADAPDPTLALYPDEEPPRVDAVARATYQAFLDALAEGRWDGDRDQWSGDLDDAVWSRVTTDHAQCSGRRCPHVRQCSFFRAREEIGKTDVIVTNHDLVLADLALGGGAILPAPEDCIFVFDEGHHLPDKARDHFARMLRLRASERWLEQGARALGTAAADLGEVERLASGLAELPSVMLNLRKRLGALRPGLESLIAEAGEESGGDLVYRFPSGEVPDTLRTQAGDLKAGFEELVDGLGKALARLDDVLEEPASPGLRNAAERWHPALGLLRQRADAGRELWALYVLEDDPGQPPRARWLDVRGGGGGGTAGGLEIALHCSPIVAAGALSRQLWQRCHAAVVTSATLTALGRFDRFRMRSGVPATAHFAVVPSPFDYAGSGTLVVPPMTADPGDPEAHTAMLVTMLPDLLDPAEGSLVLFASRRQMETVRDSLPETWQARVLMQGALSKQELLNRHRAAVDAGSGSVLFGLASLAEGVDLPGRYCSHVVIAKIPFAVPDDPVEAALAEWIRARGGNPFMEIAVPDAALRLVQASGRLLRSESDRGRITLLDRRVVSKRYGKALLDALPPFRREVAA